MRPLHWPSASGSPENNGPLRSLSTLFLLLPTRKPSLPWLPSALEARKLFLMMPGPEDHGRRRRMDTGWMQRRVALELGIGNWNWADMTCSSAGIALSSEGVVLLRACLLACFRFACPLEGVGGVSLSEAVEAHGFSTSVICLSLSFFALCSLPEPECPLKHCRPHLDTPPTAAAVVCLLASS